MQYVIGALLFFPVWYIITKWFYGKLSHVKKTSTVVLIIIGMYILIYIFTVIDKIGNCETRSARLQFCI